MITFKPRQKERQITAEIVDYLRNEQGIYPNIIREEDSDYVSKVNAKAMVIKNIVETETGDYRLTTQNRCIDRWTKKMFNEYFRMKIISMDEKSRIIVAECEHYGILLDIVEYLGSKYNLSVVLK